MISIIAAIGKNNELGHNNQLLFHIKKDMEFFRTKTEGHKVVMGRKTWDSLPSKLKNRENIVLSSHEIEGPDQVIHDKKIIIDKYLESEEEVFIIGGGAVYFQFLPFAQNIYLTEVDASSSEATTFFPEFDRKKYDKIILQEGTENGLKYTINQYRRKVWKI